MSKASKGFALLIALSLLSATAPVSYSVTAKPTPKPTVRAKVAAKPSVKTGTKVTTPKKKVVKKVYRKYKPRKRVVITPSPSPNWPPVGFSPSPDKLSYAKVPTGVELVGILSALKSPIGSVKQCSQDPKNPTISAKSCGAVLAASETGCSWWEVISQVNGVDPNNPKGQIILGNLRTLSGGTTARSTAVIILVSSIPLTFGVNFDHINVQCWNKPTAEQVPSNTFTPATASPTPSPTPSQS